MTQKLTLVVGELGEGFNVVEGAGIKHGSKSMILSSRSSRIASANFQIRPSRN